MGCSGKTLLLFPLLMGLACAVFFSPELLTRSEVRAAAVNMRGAPTTMSCPRQGPTMSVQAMQDTLQKHGIPVTPMAKFALTQYAAARDVSMRAQVQEEFSKLDPETQGKLKQLTKEVFVRAETLSPKDMAGVTAPLGFWDPVGISKHIKIAGLRRIELKHGRVCMLASLGLLVSEKFHPFFDSWGDEKFVSAVQSHFSATAAKNFWPAFWIMTFFHEFVTWYPEYEGKENFDYGFDPMNMKPKDPAKLKELQNKELNNGRLAMLGAAGILAQELVTGKSIF